MSDMEASAVAKGVMIAVRNLALIFADKCDAMERGEIPTDNPSVMLRAIAEEIGKRT